MDLYDEFTDIIKDNIGYVKGKPINEAIKGIQYIVELLVDAANLPNEVNERYKEFAGDEALLYYSESYRDHFFHPFHTFLIGFLILKRLKEENEDVVFPLENDTFLKKWLLTSMWHDITYTAEKGPNFLKGFIEKKMKFKINTNQQWGKILCDYENNMAIDKLCSHFITKQPEGKKIYFQTWLNNQIDKWNDHGVLSAILLLKEIDPEKLEKCLNSTEIYDCGLAIALHNYHKSLCNNDKDDKILTKDLGKLNIEDYPLAFLLAYCDTVQEWGRKSNKQTSYIDYICLDVNIEQKKIRVYLDYNLYNFVKSKYLFSWDQVKENNSEEFINFIKQNVFSDVEKIINKIKEPVSNTNVVSFENKTFSLILNDDKTKVTLYIDGSKIIEFKVNKENETINILPSRVDKSKNALTELINQETDKFEKMKSTWISNNFNFSVEIKVYEDNKNNYIDKRPIELAELKNLTY